MSKVSHPYVCPAEFSGSLDNKLRKLVHNPLKILGPYIIEGMKVLDLGCGPGFFTLAISELVGETGRVIAADLQEGMLDRVRAKIDNTHEGKRIKLHKCGPDNIGLTEKVDFVLAFWMIHEVPDQRGLFTELKSLLNTGGKIFIIEPKGHVTRKEFNAMIANTEKEGFKIIASPKVFFSRAVVLSEKRV
jgi:ubiquinone/menaquinone biosynthesis C-methylase UbiE